MHPFRKTIIATLALSAAFTVTACSSGSGTAESSKSSKSVEVDKRDADPKPAASAEENGATAVCDAGVISPKVPGDEIIPKVPSDEIDPKLSDDEIVPKLPECERDDTINPRLSDDHGCLDGAICVYKDPDFGEAFTTFDLHKASATSVNFLPDPGPLTSSFSLFSDGTLINDQISSIVNNSDFDATFWNKTEWTGGKIEVEARSENSNLAEWGMNDAISSMQAERKK